MLIAGNILEQQSGVPVNRVLVKVSNDQTGFKDETHTTRNGNFGIDVPIGNYTVKIEPTVHDHKIYKVTPVSIPEIHFVKRNIL